MSYKIQLQFAKILILPNFFMDNNHLTHLLFELSFQYIYMSTELLQICNTNIVLSLRMLQNGSRHHSLSDHTDHN